MAKFKIILDCKRKTMDGKYPLRLSINNFYTSSVITLPYKLKRNDWDKKNQHIKKSCTYYDVQNENIKLADFQQQFAIFIIKLSHNENLTSYTASELKSLFLKNKDKNDNDDFLKIFRIFALKKKEENPNACTYKSYLNTLNHLINFSNNSPIKIKSIDIDFLDSFVDYLKSKKNRINSIALNLRYIRAVYNYAIKIGIADYNSYPFKNYKIQKQTTLHRTIAIGDLKKMFDFKGTPSEEKALKLFKLSFYLVGINFKDLLYAKRRNIYNNRLYYKRAKTDKNISVKIIPEAQEIIDTMSGEEHILNIIENKLKIAKVNRSTELYNDVIRQTNKKLKEICTKLNININVSTYYARHTWATVARKSKVDYDIIKLALGHSNNDVTGIYIEYDTDLIDEANEKVINYLESFN